MVLQALFRFMKMSGMQDSAYYDMICIRCINDSPHCNWGHWHPHQCRLCLNVASPQLRLCTVRSAVGAIDEAVIMMRHPYDFTISESCNNTCSLHETSR